MAKRRRVRKVKRVKKRVVRRQKSDFWDTLLWFIVVFIPLVNLVWLWRASKLVAKAR